MTIEQYKLLRDSRGNFGASINVRGKMMTGQALQDYIFNVLSRYSAYFAETKGLLVPLEKEAKVVAICVRVKEVQDSAYAEIQALIA